MIKNLFDFFKVLISQRHLIKTMAKRELKSQYTGSMFGFLWTLINPLIMVLVYWVVFAVGFKVRPLNNVSFVVWLTTGLTIWFAFSEIVMGSVDQIVSNTNLIKKTLFHAEILPVIKVFPALIHHAMFLVVLSGLLILKDMPISFYYLQALYYLFCMVVLALGISWAVSALNVFSRDVRQMVGVFLQVGFWITPIFWDSQIMPPKIQFLLKLNPVYYIVQGYRESFIYFNPFWMHPFQGLYFWLVTLVIFLAGAFIFIKLKPQFADVL